MTQPTAVTRQATTAFITAMGFDPRHVSSVVIEPHRVTVTRAAWDQDEDKPMLARFTTDEGETGGQYLEYETELEILDR